MERRLCTGDRRHSGPELLATLTTPMPSMKRHDVAGGRIHSDPDPLCVRLLLDPTPPLSASASSRDTTTAVGRAGSGT